MKISGITKNVEKIVCTDPLYEDGVWCRFQTEVSPSQDYDIDININDCNYDDGDLAGYDIKIELYNKEYFKENKKNSIISVMDNHIIFPEKLIKKSKYDLGVDTARISFGVNERAEQIIEYSKDENKTGFESDDFSLNTGSDGYFGSVYNFETNDNIPVYITIIGYMNKECITKEELQDYFIRQFQIKDINIEVDKEINI